MTDETTASAWALAARIDGSPDSAENLWWIVESQKENKESTAKCLYEELRSLTEGPLDILGVEGPKEVSARIASTGSDPIIFFTYQDFTSDDWIYLDLQRSLLGRSGTTILVLSQQEIQNALNFAPNFWSWVGGQVWKVEEEEA